MIWILFIYRLLEGGGVFRKKQNQKERNSPEKKEKKMHKKRTKYSTCRLELVGYKV